MKIDWYTHIYFVGIGGIGMSALARYFLSQGKAVAGYDKTPSALTKALENEGAIIHFTDDKNRIPEDFLKPEKCLVAYTPAIPAKHSELVFFQENKFTVLKRSAVLGLLSKDKHCIAISGTHGKTTVSSMTAHILHNSSQRCTAFLGGITSNYNSNFLLNEQSNNLVVEADEFDRSFLQLHPNVAVITSMDADHLDIYASHNLLKENFQAFVNQIQPNGQLLIKETLKQQIHTTHKVFTYAIDSKTADFTLSKLELKNGNYYFSIVGPDLEIKDMTLEMAGKINIENALAASAAAHLNGIDATEIKAAIASFKGVKRRLEYIIKTNDLVYMDDYAHHPEELKASIQSVQELYPNKKVCGIFQPHLYSRTRDFLTDFANSLALLDQLILLEIYPAREEPIEGVTSQLLLEKVPLQNKILLQKDALVPYLQNHKPQVLLTLGAGDIDRFVEPIKQALSC